jgi:hypothetical protein
MRPSLTTLSSTFGMLAGRWHKRRQKISGIRHVPPRLCVQATSFPRKGPRQPGTSVRRLKLVGRSRYRLGFSSSGTA